MLHKSEKGCLCHIYKSLCREDCVMNVRACIQHSCKMLQPHTFLVNVTVNFYFPLFICIYKLYLNSFICFISFIICVWTCVLFCVDVNQETT